MNMRIINDISNFIFVEDSLKKADVILIPGGSYPELPERAAELWKEGWADLIVPSGKYSVKLGKFAGVKSKKDIYDKDYLTEAEFQADVLLKSGVPQDKFLLEAESECTADNARFTRKLLDEKEIKLEKAILCCKGFHARRALMFYQFCFPETEFIVVPVTNTPDLNITRDNWYRTDIGLKRVQGELARLGVQFAPELERLKEGLE